MKSLLTMKSIALMMSAGWLLGGFGAFAAQRVLVVGSGDCRDATLATSVQAFHEAARGLIRGELLEPEAVLDKVRPRPSRSLEDIERQIEAARSSLYSGQHDRGLEAVRQALKELERASPQVAPWPVTSGALLLEAQFHKRLGHVRLASEAFRQVLRIDPQLQLDPDAYPPSTIATFEAIRRELLDGRRPTLRVESTPSDARVFVDGREMGRTPLAMSLVSGTYRLSLMHEEGLSFPRRIELSQDLTVQVELRFESTLSQQPPLCITSRGDEEVLRLGAAVSADQVIVLRNSAGPGNPPYLTAVSYELATGKQLQNGGTVSELLARLAAFILTGQSQTGVSPGLEPPPSVRPGPVAPMAMAPVSRTPAGELVAKSNNRAARIASYGLVAAGAGAAVAGAIVFGLGAAERNRLQALGQPDGRLNPAGTPAYVEAMALGPSVDANRLASFSFFGAGVGLATAGVLGLVLFPSGSPLVTVAPSSEGLAVSTVISF